MGKELRRIGAPFRQPEWSALALMEAPERVVDAHRNFIEAGAEIITTNNYAVVPFHLGEERFERDGSALVALAGKLARQAAGAGVLVAGSMPPLFGSYEPDELDSFAAAPAYRMIAGALRPHVDLWIGETLSACAEVDLIVDAIRSVDAGSERPIWISFAFPDEWGDHGVATRSGESPTDIANVIARHADDITAVLVNCTIPEQTREALAALRAALTDAGVTVETGAYANAFPSAQIDPGARQPGYRANNTILERRTDLTAERYADFVAEWIDDGATLIGGCCDMYPEHIAEIARRFRD